MTEAYIYDVLRTPRGRGKPGGALYGVKPITLVVDLLHALQQRNPGLDPARIEDVMLGVVSPVGEQGGVISRAAAVAAGLSTTAAGLQLDRFCASGLESVNIAAQKVRSGWDHLIVAGGVESMSRVPMGSDGGAWVLDPETNYDTYFVPQGISADLIATLGGFTREDCDGYALSSQERAAKAWAGGHFARSIVPVRDRNGVLLLDRDEHLRPETSPASLAALAPAFAPLGEMGGFDAVALQKYHWLERIEHVHTPGNSSGIVDGAALVLVGSEQAGHDLELTPRARVVSAAVVATEPTIMLTGPAPAARKALATAGLDAADIDLFEVNEAFSSVVLRFAQELDVESERLNVNGGAIAMGHPLGATGAMILGTLVDELERRDLRRGLATLCIGGGMGVATIVERV